MDIHMEFQKIELENLNRLSRDVQDCVLRHLLILNGNDDNFVLFSLDGDNTISANAIAFTPEIIDECSKQIRQIIDRCLDGEESR